MTFRIPGIIGKLGTAARKSVSDFLQTSKNLSDVNAATAKTNLGLEAVASSASASDLSTGTLSAARLPALTGDVTRSAGSATTSIASGAVTFAKLASAAIATAANFLANTSSLLLTTDKVWGAAAEVSITYAASTSLDFSTFINGAITLTGDLELTNPTNLKAGQSGIIRLIQDSTGSRTLTVSGTDYTAAGGVSTLVLSTAAGAVDYLAYYVRSTGEVFLALSQEVTH